MNAVTVNRKVLLKKIKKNREGHSKIFLEACDGYRKFMVAEFEKRLTEIKSGKPIRRSFDAPEPQDHTRDYDRVIQMLEMEVSDTVELDQYSFASYVMDDWEWKAQFLTSNALYSQTAKRMSP